jgi:phage shock protein C
MLMNRRLYRSRTDTVIGGVAAGVAAYLNADPALVRIAWAILVPLTGGAALLAYIVAWIVVPEAPATVSRIVDPDGAVVEVPAVTEVDAAPAPPGAAGNGALIVGLILIGAGLWFLLREYLPEFDWGLIWPIILIGIGGLILVTSSRRRGDS